MRKEVFMKEGKFAIYGGKEYSAEKNRNGKMLLRSTNISDVENGFEACKPFEFRNCKEKIVGVLYYHGRTVYYY